MARSAAAAPDIHEVVARLPQAHPDARYELDWETPVQLLVATILAAQCTDERVNRVTKTLFVTYPDAAAFADADRGELEEALKPTGFFRQKAKKVQEVCQAVVARGTMIFLRGQCPQDLDTAADIGSHDAAEQTHKVMQNIRQLIEEAGGRMEHLCKVVVYLTDVRHREAVYRVMGEYIKGVHPVSTGVVVTALARPSWLVEIDATAVIPD